MSIPGPLIGGTIVYAIIGAVLMALTFGALVTGKLSKDNAASVSYTHLTLPTKA